MQGQDEENTTKCVIKVGAYYFFCICQLINVTIGHIQKVILVEFSILPRNDGSSQWHCEEAIKCDLIQRIWSYIEQNGETKFV